MKLFINFFFIFYIDYSLFYSRTCSHNDEDMLLFARKKDLRLRSLEGGGTPSYDVVLPIDGVKSVVAVAWDSASRKLFWTDTGAQSISSSNIDGQNQKEIVSANLGICSN